MPESLRPRPAINRDNAFFFEALGRGELVIQRCDSCEELRHPPVPMCPHCHALEWSAAAMTGRGAVFSHVVMHHPIVPPFEAGYAVGLIELEEGPRMIMNIEGIAANDIEIGMSVSVTAELVDSELVLPVARPTERRA